MKEILENWKQIINEQYLVYEDTYTSFTTLPNYVFKNCFISEISNDSNVYTYTYKYDKI